MSSRLGNRSGFVDIIPRLFGVGFSCLHPVGVGRFERPTQEGLGRSPMVGEFDLRSRVLLPTTEKTSVDVDFPDFV